MIMGFMPMLKNPRHEAFAQALARGMSATAAYVEAGYKSNRHNAAALAREKHIRTRVTELQEEQLAILHRELDVLDVEEFAFKASGTLGEFSCHLGKPGGEPIGVAGHPPAGDYILALSIGEKIDIELFRAGCWISRKCDTGARFPPALPKTIA